MGWHGARRRVRSGASTRNFRPAISDTAPPSGRLDKYGQWLLTLPVAIVINDTLFMHGGPSAVLAGLIDAVNLRYRTALTDYLGSPAPLEQAGLLQRRRCVRRPAAARRRTPGGCCITECARQATAIDASPWRSASRGGRQLLRSARTVPTGTAAPRCATKSPRPTCCNPLMQQFGVTRLVVGHTPTRDRAAVSRFDGAVIKLDAGMNTAAYKGRAAALILEQGKAQRAYAGRAAPAE